MFCFFLERVLSEERENVNGGHGFLIIAVHAVMLESGFLGFDPGANKGVRGFGLPQGWGSKGLVRLRYTLPELVDVNGDGKSAEHVELKFEVMGNVLAVFGSQHRRGISVEHVELKFEVVGNFWIVFGSQHRRHSLEVGKYLPSLEHAIRENLSSKKEFQNPCEIVKSPDSSVHEKVLFDLWRVVKDRLCMPVLSALCEKTGLPLHPLLMMLPTELKMKILEALPAVDVAKMGCLCREFKFLYADDELWKQKYMDEFGFLPPNGSRPFGAQTWKDAFMRMWIKRKRISPRRRRRRLPFKQTPQPFRRFPPPPSPFGGSWLNEWGVDYDQFPAVMLGGGPLGAGSLLEEEEEAYLVEGGGRLLEEEEADLVEVESEAGAWIPTQDDSGMFAAGSLLWW